MSKSLPPHRPQTSFNTPPIFPILHRKRSSSRSPSPPGRRPPPPHSGPRLQAHVLTTLATHSLPPPPLPPATLRQRHISTLTALLHHALSTNDHARAIRAYGLLLRSPTTDIRTFWALGVHLLIRTGRPSAAVELVSRLALLYPYQRGTHAQHASLNHGRTTERGTLVRPSVLEFGPGLLETLVCVGEEGEEGEEGRAGKSRRRVWERIEEWMVGPPWAEVREMWLWRGCVAGWCAQRGGVSGEERARWRAEMERAWKGYEERGGVVPSVVRWEEEEREDGEDDGEKVVGDEEEEEEEEEEA